MVTGDIGYEQNAALLSLLEFESTKYRLPIEFRLVDLSNPPQENFRKTVQVFCHGIGERHSISLPFDEGSVNVETRGYNMKGLVSLSNVPEGIIGFCGEDYLHPVAHVEANRLYIYYNLLDVDSSVLGRLFDYVFSAAMPLLKTNIENYDYREEREKYANIKLIALKSKEQELTNNITTNENSLQEATESIVRLTRAIAADRVMVEALQAKTDRRKTEDAGREYFSLMKLVPTAYRDIGFTDHEITAKTHPIDIMHEGIDYHIGEFEVKVAFETGTVTITNTTEPREGYQHPHISSPESICLGNISIGIAKLIGASDYAPALSVLLEYLNSYNPDDTYMRIEHWGEGGYTDHDNCYENSSTWDCLECSDEDCPFFSDRYDRCWENANTSECIECGISCPYREDAMSNCRENHTARECMECQQACSYQFDEYGCREDAEDMADVDGVSPCMGCSITDCQYAEDEPEEPEPAETDDEVEGLGIQEDDNTDRLAAILAEEA